MSSLPRILMASLLCLASSAAGQSKVDVQTKDEIFPAPGNSCVFSTNPVGDIGDLPPTTVQWNFGGDAGVGGSDSRSVYIRPKADGQDLVEENGTRTPLTNGQTYTLRVNDFTVPVGSTPPSTRPAKLYGPGGLVASLQLELTVGTDWPIDDFFYTSGPGSSTSMASLTGYLFDVTGGNGTPKDGFCVTFEIEGPLGSGNGNSFDALIQLNPDNNAPGTPQINFSFDFDGLNGTTGDGLVQVDAIQATTLDTVDFPGGQQGTISVTGMLSMSTASGKVTYPNVNPKPPVILSDMAPGYLPAPDFTVIVMGSLTGSRQSTLRFVPDGGRLIDIDVTQ